MRVYQIVVFRTRGFALPPNFCSLGGAFFVPQLSIKIYHFFPLNFKGLSKKTEKIFSVFSGQKYDKLSKKFSKKMSLPPSPLNFTKKQCFFLQLAQISLKITLNPSKSYQKWCQILINFAKI